MAPLTKIKTEPPAPTETPVTSETPTTPETQTMADVFGGMPSVETMDPTMESIYGGYKADATQSVDPRKIRSDITNQFSDRLTSLGSIYDRQLEKVTRQQEEASDAELGRARALEARGIGGFGNVVQANRRANTALQDATQSVADAKTLALDKIYGDIDTLTASETASKRAAKAAGASNFLNYIKEQKTRKDNYSNELAQSLLNDPVLATREFTDKDFEELAKRGATLGLTKGDVATAYRAAKKMADQEAAAAEAAALKAEIDSQFNLSEGQARYDKDGNLIAARGKTYAPSSSSGSTPAPGTPEAIAQNDAAIANATQILGTVNDAINQVSFASSGFLGAQSRNVGGTPAYNLERTINTIKANLAFEELAKMRAASKTGGALGSITERELDLLGATVANLDVGQSEAQLRANLEDIRTRYENIQAALQGIELVD